MRTGLWMQEKGRTKPPIASVSEDKTLKVYYKIIGRHTCLRNLKVQLEGYLRKDSESGKCVR
jgi:hypothetical protein